MDATRAATGFRAKSVVSDALAVLPVVGILVSVSMPLGMHLRAREAAARRVCAVSAARAEQTRREGPAKPAAVSQLPLR